MNKSELEKIKKDYRKIWKQRCSLFSKEPPISIIKKAPERIIVIGDLHGDWNKTIEILRLSKVIDEKENPNWIGGDTIVVQLGDQIDRCRLDKGECHLKGSTYKDEASDLKILLFLTKLHKKAQKDGGAVYSILGNHELMNVNGDFRYVSRKNILQFSNLKKNPKKEKKISVSKIKKIVSDKDPIFSSEEEDEMIKKGNKNRKDLFHPGNSIANFLACTRKMALVIGSNLFAHAGIVPEIANKYNIENMNQIIALYLFDKLKDPNKYNDLLINSNKSPLWNRLLGNLNKHMDSEYVDELCEEIFDYGLQTKLLGNEKQRINRTFIGHTPQIYKGINSTCKNNKIYYVDVGMSDAFNFTNSNIIQAAEIIGDQVNIISKT